MSNAVVEGRGEPFFWHTHPTAEQVQLMTTATQEPTVNTYWQEPVLQKEDIFPEERKKPVIRERYKGSIVEPLPTYRTYRNTQF